MEEILHGITLLSLIARGDAFKDVMPESTILPFRHLLEQHDLPVAFFAEVNVMLLEKGLSMKSGMVTDATLIAAPSSTRHGDKKREPEMTQIRKGNQWHLGMKAHIWCGHRERAGTHLGMYDGQGGKHHNSGSHPCTGKKKLPWATGDTTS